MAKSNRPRTGRHFLQIPGPTNVPDRVLRAIDRPTIDHRGPEFADLTLGILGRIKTVFGTSGPVVMYPGSGTGAWEAALVNTLSPGDKVVAFEHGHFAALWRRLAEGLGLDVEIVAGDWRQAVDPAAVEARLAEDRDHAIKAVMVVHNETSTGVTSPIAEIRAAIDRAGHPALFMVDAVSSLASLDYRHDSWGVDVTVAGSQKGLMLPPGIGFNAVSGKALEAAESAKMPRAYWNWKPILDGNANGFYPYTPPTNLFFGLEAALEMLHEEGLENVHARHNRLAEATRRAVAAWGLGIYCSDPAFRSDVTTAVMMPEGHDADILRNLILDRFDMSLGVGLAKLQGNVFRIGHLGYFNDLMLAGTLCGIEMGLALANVPHEKGGVDAALDYLAGTA